MIVDASERGPHGAAFAQKWLRHVIDAAAENIEPTIEQITSLMRTAHYDLRTKYPAEIACYGVLLVRHDLNQAWTLNCGDCRIGIHERGEAVEWVTPVHTLANMFGEQFNIAHARSNERHTVTRALKAGRFMMPDIRAFTVSMTAQFALATDGYWVDDFLNTPLEQRDYADDASIMMLSTFEVIPEVETDCENWYAIQRLSNSVQDFPV